MSVLVSHQEVPSTLLLLDRLSSDNDENKTFPVIQCSISSSASFYVTLLGQLFSSSHLANIFRQLITQLDINSDDKRSIRAARIRLQCLFSSIHHRPHFVQLQSHNKFNREEESINRRWAAIQLHVLVIRVRYESSWAWLSTLGGGHSCLGERSSRHALEAEVISKDQVCLSRDIGDPNAICKSYLFVALSYLQQKRYDEVRTILRFQYGRIQQPDITDERLRIMCIALWKKMKYAIKQNEQKPF